MEIAMIVNTMAQLHERVQSLAAPKSGFQRVFRGQSRKYERMLPSGLRPGTPWNIVWKLYAKSLSNDLIGNGVVAGKETRETEFKDWFLWLEAIAQHYGGGSDFLDVTRSLDIALWFALHEGSEIDVKVALGQGTQPDL